LPRQRRQCERSVSMYCMCKSHPLQWPGSISYRKARLHAAADAVDEEEVDQEGEEGEEGEVEGEVEGGEREVEGEVEAEEREKVGKKKVEKKKEENEGV
jgi:hypothetical protein